MITVSVDVAPLSSTGPGPETFCPKVVDVRHPAKMKGAHNANRSVWQERFWITMLSSSAPSQSTSRFLHAKTLPRDFSSYGDCVSQDVASPAAPGKVFWGLCKPRLNASFGGCAMWDQHPHPIAALRLLLCGPPLHPVPPPISALDDGTLAATLAAARRAASLEASGPTIDDGPMTRASAFT